MAVVAFSLLALKLTSHAVLIAGVAIASRLPWLFVALPAGALVDKVDRRRLVVSVDLVRAAVLGVVALGALTAPPRSPRGLRGSVPDRSG